TLGLDYRSSSNRTSNSRRRLPTKCQEAQPHINHGCSPYSTAKDPSYDWTCPCRTLQIRCILVRSITLTLAYRSQVRLIPYKYSLILPLQVDQYIIARRPCES